MTASDDWLRRTLACDSGWPPVAGKGNDIPSSVFSPSGKKLAMPRHRRKYRRTAHYPGHLSVAVTMATQEAVQEVADRAGWSVAETVRECIEIGLPVVKSQLTTSRDGNQGAPVGNP